MSTRTTTIVTATGDSAYALPSGEAVRGREVAERFAGIQRRTERRRGRTPDENPGGMPQKNKEGNSPPSNNWHRYFGGYSLRMCTSSRWKRPAAFRPPSSAARPRQDQNRTHPDWKHRGSRSSRSVHLHLGHSAQKYD